MYLLYIRLSIKLEGPNDNILNLYYNLMRYYIKKINNITV